MSAAGGGDGGEILADGGEGDVEEIGEDDGVGGFDVCGGGPV